MAPKAIPWGVYDRTRNEGWASVGIDHDTAGLAAASSIHPREDRRHAMQEQPAKAASLAGAGGRIGTFCGAARNVIAGKN